MDRLRAVRLALGVVLLGLAIHLVVGEKPWEGDAAELLRQGKKVYFLDLARIYRYWISAGNLVVVAVLWWSAPAAPARPTRCSRWSFPTPAATPSGLGSVRRRRLRRPARQAW